MVGTINKEIAECVGLWLAEGSQNSKFEITFTNNSMELIEFFKEHICKLFNNYTFNQRIYVYTPDGSKPELKFKDCIIKYYVHKRATKPYYIFRIASVDIVRKWKALISETLDNESFYVDILRGFFAGEGNIHEGKKSVRVIRISQKERKEFIDRILDHLRLNYNFTISNRMYNLSNKRNWDIFANNKIADLHPNKKEKFWRLYNSYKEEHYDKNYLKGKVFEMLAKEKTAKELSVLFNRSQARVSEILIALKKDGKAVNYRVGHLDFWIRDFDTIVISKIKSKYLKLLEEEKTTAQLSDLLGVTWWSVFKRLKELERLRLVERGSDKRWKKIQTEKKIVVI